MKTAGIVLCQLEMSRQREKQADNYFKGVGNVNSLFFRNTAPTKFSCHSIQLLFEMNVIIVIIVMVAVIVRVFYSLLPFKTNTHKFWIIFLTMSKCNK
ncbi:hypothetical protein GQX74_006341 [Glossina fuscipes]|nr:hypothetical protein GQX74_006341 [Glossina fuscipes]